MAIKNVYLVPDINRAVLTPFEVTHPRTGFVDPPPLPCAAMLIRCSKKLWLTCSFVVLLAGLGLAQEEDQDVVRFEPAELIHVIEGTVHEVTWYTILPDVSRVSASVEDPTVAEVVGASDVTRSAPGGNATHYGSLNVSALFIGYNKVRVTLFDRQDVVVGEGTLDMSVLLSYQKLNDIFTLAIGILVAVVYVNMGATMNLEIIKDISKKPIGPLLGIVCQYLFMPLIAFGLGKLAFPGNVLAQLGMFLTGCSPGGGLSNMWTYLLGGSLDLSILMTGKTFHLTFNAECHALNHNSHAPSVRVIGDSADNPPLCMGPECSVIPPEEAELRHISLA
ncbi:hypothetical protein C7M84_018343 [Penaeus vannamei]|uniref:Solute carrier family 10 member 6 n=1 Tax=Penaeus vannamei TaxID=6689 RepID=A0A423SHN0_PENVA|nr:hypothetical protein C7M84_018343 [Penaeus vannamei]